jgi:hypothetical protein
MHKAAKSLRKFDGLTQYQRRLDNSDSKSGHPRTDLLVFVREGC